MLTSMMSERVAMRQRPSILSARATKGSTCRRLAVVVHSQPQDPAHRPLNRKSRHFGETVRGSADETRRMKEGGAMPSRPELDNSDGGNKWVAYLGEKWDGLTLQQKIWTGIAGLALLAVVPRVLLVLFVGVERVLVGGLLALEEVIVQGVFKATALGLVVGVIALVGTGLYVFLGPKKESN